MTATSDSLDAWRSDARELCPSWLRKIGLPVIVRKRGYFSPWYLPLPQIWLIRSGAFSVLMFIVISEDLVDCPPRYRRALIAHECGHFLGLHALIWIGLIYLLFKTPIAQELLQVSLTAGRFGPLGAGLLLIAGAMHVVTRLQRWFEHQADDFAVRHVGIADTLATLKWLRELLFNGKAAPWPDERIRRLERVATNPASHT